MSQPTKKDYDELLARRKQTKRTAPYQNRRAAGEAMRISQQAEELTGKDEWDWLVSHMEDKRASNQLSLDEVRKRFSVPQAVDDSYLRGLRDAAIGLEAAIETLEYVIGLPKQLIEKGKDALEAQDAAAEAD